MIKNVELGLKIRKVILKKCFCTFGKQKEQKYEIV